MGAVLIQKERIEPTMKEYKSIDSEAIEDFLTELLNTYPGKKLKVICERGPYHTSKATKNFVAQNDNIELIYLPPRCPNLNLIERLWKIIKENVTHNKYYSHFSEFQKAIRSFFTEKITQIQPILASRLKDNFHIINPIFLQTVC